jgi:glucose/arabinose dehydrogenase
MDNILSFDSNSQNLVLQSTGVGVNVQDLLLSGDFTIEFQLYLDPNQSITNEDGIVSAGIFGNGNDINFQEGKLHFYSSNFNGNGIVVNSTTPADTGKWNHYVIARENGQTKIYINGEVDAVSTQNWTGDFAISAIAQSLSGGLQGQLDELRIWNVARNQTEIQNHINSSVDVNSSGLERYYRFDDEPVGHIIDATGNAETGHELHPPTGTSIVNAAEEVSSGEFIDTQVVSGLFLPTDIAFLPDGRMLVLEKSGLVKIVEDPTKPNSNIEIYMDLSQSVLNAQERGLLAIEVDPNFETNGYFYLFYTNKAEYKTTVSRFQHSENTGGVSSRGNITSETVLWQEHDVTSKGDHQGGGLAIAYEPNGDNDPSPYKIYITVGEEFEPLNSQDLSHDDGKVHRINLTDGSIPTDNPYYEASTAANYNPQIDTSSAISSAGIIQTIYSYGLRNPFRASYDQISHTLFIGEVGGNDNYTSREDIHIASSGTNLGWPLYEGYLDSSEDPGNPIYSYPHLNGPGPGGETLLKAKGAAVTGGLVYRGNDFPEQYQGVYFYGDWVRKWIRYLELDYSGDRPTLIADHYFKDATGQVLSFEQAPDGSLYYITTFQTGNYVTFQGSVNRLDWSANNSTPIGTGIILSPEELESSTTPHTVTFEANVTDPDSDALSYRWSFGDGIDLDGDGIGDTATSTEANPTYTYTEKGEYTVELIVTDAQGAATVFDSQKIIVGHKPEVTISPLNNYLFRAGDTITFTGFATDFEDGNLSGDSVVWSSVFLHNEHFHPGFSGVANQIDGISLYIEDHGHDYSSDTGYEVFLTATDSDGITTSKSVIIRPDKVDITFDAPIPNYTFLIDDIPHSGDFTYDTLINFNHTIQAQEYYIYDGFEYNFSHWEDNISNKNPIRNFVVPEIDQTLRPIYSRRDVASNAISLNGSSGIAVPNVVVGQDNGNFTIEAWIKFTDKTTITNNDGLISSGTYKNGNDINFYQGKFRLFVSGKSDVVVANYQSRPDIWTHYALVREHGVMKVYVDGQLDNTQATNWSGALAIDEIGGGIAPGGLNGQLDELRVWSVARSAEEIDANKEVRIDATTSGLERYYQFDGGITDLTGNSNQVALPDYAQLVESTAPVYSFSGNLSPTAVDDTATVTEGSTTYLHILDNDFDLDGSINPQMVEILVAPSHGIVEIIDTQAELNERGLELHHFGHAEYTPDADFVGVDSFTYRVQDNDGAWSNPATITVTVEPVIPSNLSPTAVDDTATVTEGSTTYLHILDNDFDLDGSINPQMVEILVAPSHGIVEIIDTQAELDERGLNLHHFGHAEYTPDADFVGIDSFTYRVQDNDGAWSNPATMTVTVEADTPTINQALNLNGKGGIDIEDLTLSGDFTIEAWVKFSANSAITNNDGLVNSGKYVYKNGNDINFYQGKARIFSDDYQFGKDPVIANQDSVTGQWMHYAFVRENGVAQIYIDGVLDATSSHNWQDDFRIAEIGSGIATGGLKGQLDELRIWSVPRSAEEINMNKGVSIEPTTSGLERYYQFDDSQGIIDVTGNSYGVTVPNYAQLVPTDLTII